jgi:site-specific recombinase XerD
MASRLMAQGQPIETVQLLLGRAELDHVRPYLQISNRALEDMFASVL